MRLVTRCETGYPGVHNHNTQGVGMGVGGGRAGRCKATTERLTVKASHP